MRTYALLLHALAISTAILGLPTQVCAQTRSYLYDKKTQIYYAIDFKSLKAIVYPNGQTEIWDSKFRPLFTSNYPGPVPSASESPDGPVLFLLQSLDKFDWWKLQGDGSIVSKSIFGSGLLDCPKQSPSDRCNMDSFVHTRTRDFAYYYHRTLGSQIAQWNGTAYEPVTAPFATATPQELASLGAATSLEEDFGEGKPRIFADRQRFGLGKKVLLLHDNQLSEQALTALSPDINDINNVALRRLGSDIYLLSQAYSGGYASALRLQWLDGKLEQALVQTEDQASHPWTRWIGIDAEGYAYGHHPETQAFGALQLQTGKLLSLGSCLNAARIPGPENDPIIWLACGSQLFRVQNAQVVLQKSFEHAIVDGLVSSQEGEPFSALVRTSDQKLHLFQGGETRAAQGLKHLRSPEGSSPGLAWNDGSRWCRTSEEKLEGDQHKTSRIRCLKGQEWILRTDSALPPPLDLMETQNFTWYVAQDEALIKVWRRGRAASDVWQLVDSAAPTPSRSLVRFLPSIKPDELGLMGSGDFIKVFDKSGQTSDTRVAQTDLYEARAALDAEGWIYGLCPALPPANIVTLNICSFSPEGIKHELAPLISETGSTQVFESFFPLQRGVLFKAGFDAVNAKVLHRTQFIPLAQLFGEFKSTAKRRVALTAWSTGDGSALLKRSRSYDAGLSVVDLFSFNGTKLQQLGEKVSDRSLTTNRSLPFSTEKLPITSRFPQMWQGFEGLWHRSSLGTDEIPHLTRRSPAELLVDLPLDPNVMTAAAHFGAQTVFATVTGLWFCPSMHAQPITPSTPRFERSQACQLHALPLSISQIIASDILLLRVGSILYSYDPVAKRLELVIDSIASPGVQLDGSSILYAKAKDLWSYDLKTKSAVSLSSLPDGLDGTDLIAFDRQRLCSAKGLFASHPSEGWRLQAASCRAGLPQAQTFYAAAGETLMACKGEVCEAVATLPLDERQDLALGYQQNVVIASGRQVWRLDGESWQSCSMPWAQGNLPLSNVTKIDGDMLLTQGTGVVRDACTAQPAMFRLH